MASLAHPDRGHDRFGAAAEHAEQIDRGVEFTYLLGDLEFILVEQSRGRPAVGDEGLDFFTNGREIAAQHGRPACLEEIDVAVAVEIVEIGALGLGENDRVGIVESQVMLDAPRDVLLGDVDHTVSTCRNAPRTRPGTPAWPLGQ